jgi:hypothetical protein
VSFALKDTKGAGNADVIERFGDGVPQGSAGGTAAWVVQRLLAARW